jgi:hypothetical protein
MKMNLDIWRKLRLQLVRNWDLTELGVTGDFCCRFHTSTLCQAGQADGASPVQRG